MSDDQAVKDWRSAAALGLTTVSLAEWLASPREATNPWNHAKKGEVWLVGETEAPAVVGLCYDNVTPYFIGDDWGHAAHHAKIARRIYPEGSA